MDTRASGKLPSTRDFVTGRRDLNRSGQKSKWLIGQRRDERKYKAVFERPRRPENHALKADRSQTDSAFRLVDFRTLCEG